MRMRRRFVAVEIEEHHHFMFHRIQVRGNRKTYIEQGFQKLCKGSGNEDSPVIFLKHNVLDEYDERSEVAERLRIRSVPLFYFYKNGLLLEAFPTRDKVRILDAISKYTTSSSSSSERVDSLK